MQQTVNVLDVVERVIEEEGQFGGAPQLISCALGQLGPNGSHVGIDIFEQLLPRSLGNTLKRTRATLRSDDTRTELTLMITPCVLAVSSLKISLNSFCTSREIFSSLVDCILQLIR